MVPNIARQCRRCLKDLNHILRGFGWFTKSPEDSFSAEDGSTACKLLLGSIAGKSKRGTVR